MWRGCLNERRHSAIRGRLTMRVDDSTGSGTWPGAAATKTPVPVARSVPVLATLCDAEEVRGVSGPRSVVALPLHDTCSIRAPTTSPDGDRSVLVGVGNEQMKQQCAIDARNRHNAKKKLVVISRLVLLLAVGILGSASKQQKQQQQRKDGNQSPVGGTASSSSGAARWTPLPTADAAPIASKRTASVVVGEGGDIEYLDGDDNSREGDGDSRSVERYRTLDDYLADVSGSPRRTRSDGGSSNVNEDDVIVVATIDGTMAGISRSNGRTLWKRTGSSATTTINDTAPTATTSETSPPSEAPNLDAQVGLFAPLVSTTTTTKNGSGSRRGGDWRTAAVPSVDGRVYLTPGRDKNLPADVAAATAVTTAKELVSRAPFVDARGRFYVGSRTATAAALDRDTGEILRLVGGDGTTSGIVNENGEEAMPSLEGRNIVWVGRADYSVSVFDARSGDVDVRFSTSEVLSVGDMFRGGQIGSGSGEADDAVAGEIWDDNGIKNPLLSLPGSERSEGAPFNDHSTAYSGSEYDESDIGGLAAAASLIATPSGNLALRDAITGEVAWVSDATFETPVAYAVDSSGGQSIGVDIVPDAVVPCDDKEYVKEELERQLAQMEGRVLGDDAELSKGEGRSGQANSDASGAATDETIVGALESGQLFAMPLGNAKRSNYKGRRQPFLPGLPRPLPSSRTQQGGGAASQASSRQWHRGPVPRHHAHAVGGDNGDWQHSQHQQAPQSIVNDATSTSLAMINSACRPGQPNFPSCLVGSRLNQPQRKWKDYDGDGIPDGDGSFLDPNTQMLDPRSDAALKALMMTGYHLNPDYFDGSLWNDPDLFDEERSRQQQKRSRFKAFLRIMSSWVPPAVALAFVVSFELGRRERLKAEKQLLEKTQGDDDNSDMSLKRALAADEEVRSRGVVGAIKVSDIVLGYGGHGTVVYKGSLDGRSIAVKRMLKTYHASANREISLLIESDGHPNVVRYFLKEVRGDFVYLALELCDMSLHELIAAIGEHKYWRKEKSSGKKRHSRDVGGGKDAENEDFISHATRDMLLQIASGVRHLHSLRIVHRDLKPQNILLAHQDTSRNKQGSTSKTNLKDGNPTDTRKEEADESIYEAFEEGEYVPKISDMGLGKQLVGQSSFGLSTLGNASAGLAAAGASGQSKDVAGAGPGSVGWQAPEVMAQRRLPEGRALSMSLTRTCSDAGGACSSQDDPTGGLVDSSPIEVDLPTAAVRTSRSVDIFSLGCIFYCTIIPGSHPFGEWYEREANIMKNEPSTIALEKISVEASDLVCSMIARDPKQRPTAAQVCLHPFFWDAARRLAFLCQLSDRLEATSPTLAESTDSSLQRQTNVDPFLVDRNAATVVGSSWDKNLDEGLLSNVSRFRTYDPSSVRDLLRLIRNKYHHFDELPEDVKLRLGPNPTDLITYFQRLFPGLVMHCFRVCRDNLIKDDPLVLKFCIPSKLDTMSSHAASSSKPLGDGCQAELANISIEANDASLDNKSLATSPSTKDADTSENVSYYKVLACTQSSLTATENEDSKEMQMIKSTMADNSVEEKPLSLTTEKTLVSAQLLTTLVEKEKGGEDADITIADTTISPRTTRPQKVFQEGEDADQIQNTSSRTVGASSSITMAAESTSAATLALLSEPTTRSRDNEAPATSNAAEGMVIWEGSTAAKTFNCRGWYRSEDEWARRVDSTLRKRDANVTRCATDPKFRTRLCNHWDSSQGTHCPMRRKKKCIFAHGPVELRVKEGKRNRWGKLVDSEGNCSNPKASGGEDTYGAARSIEAMREKEGKWTPNKRGTPSKNANNNNNTGRYRGKQSGDGGSKKSGAAPNK